MLNREIAIFAIMVSIPVTYFLLFQAQGASAHVTPRSGQHLPSVKRAGLNMTSAVGNTTGGRHDSSIHTTNPAAWSAKNAHNSSIHTANPAGWTPWDPA